VSILYKIAANNINTKKVKLYRAVKNGDKEIKLFKKYKAKPEGYYFAPTEEIAHKWGSTLHGQGNYSVKEFEFPGNTPAIAARDGYQSEYPRDNKYFTDRLSNAVDYITNHPMKIRWMNGLVEENPYALPEIILKKI